MSTTIDYLIVSDFECNSGMKGFVLHEIIEFPLVLIDVKQKKIIHEFTTFIRPTYHPRLTNFIKKLTFIEQEDVDKAPTLQEALYQFRDVICEKTNNSTSTFLLFDCDADAVYLRAEINLKKLSVCESLLKYVNLKKAFEKCFLVEGKSMEFMMKHLNLPIKGHAHIALDDAKNISQIVMTMLEKGYSFQKSELSDVILDN